MSFLTRFRRESDDEAPKMPLVLPHVNQRISVTRAIGDPSPSRVDDETDEQLVILSPNMPLREGEVITLNWQEGPVWFSMETRVVDVFDEALRPTVTLSKRGRVTRFEDRRRDLRGQVTLPIEVQVVNARVVRSGRELRTRTIELGTSAVRFATSAPFAPGDVVELMFALSEMDTVKARGKVIRMDAVQGSWRQNCTAFFEEILQSDRDRILHFLEQRVQRENLNVI